MKENRLVLAPETAKPKGSRIGMTECATLLQRQAAQHAVQMKELRAAHAAERKRDHRLIQVYVSGLVAIGSLVAGLLLRLRFG